MRKPKKPMNPKSLANLRPGSYPLPEGEAKSERFTVRLTPAQKLEFERAVSARALSTQAALTQALLEFAACTPERTA